MANTNQRPREDYGLDERDISRPIGDEHPDKDFFDEEELHPHGDDINRDHRHYDHFEEEQSSAPASQNKHEPEGPVSFWSKYRVHLIVGGCALLVFGGLCWAALQMMAPKPVQRKAAPTDFTSQAMMQRSSPASAPATDPVLIDEAVIQEPQHELPVVELPQQPPVPQMLPQVAPITQRVEQEQDDTFYDELVRSSDRGAPVEQRAGTVPGSVSSRTDDKLEALSKALADSSRDIGIVLNAVKVLNEDVKSLRQQVEVNGSKSAALEVHLNKVSSGLDDLAKKTEARLKDISKNAVTAALAAVNKEQKPKQEKLVLVGGKRESDYRPAPKPVSPVTKSVPPAFEKAPVRTVATVVPPENKGNQGQQCKARTVSEHWKVKGITNSGAYVRRSNGEAVMLRIGNDVADFGSVVSFDPVSRTVCTTRGLIAR